jgi:hypothetical protein
VVFNHRLDLISGLEDVPLEFVTLVVRPHFEVLRLPVLLDFKQLLLDFGLTTSFQHDLLHFLLMVLKLQIEDLLQRNRLQVDLNVEPGLLHQLLPMPRLDKVLLHHLDQRHRLLEPGHKAT